MMQEKHAAALPAGFVAPRLAEREKGTGAPFVIEERGQVLGACGLEGLGHDAAVWCFVNPAVRGKGHATFGVRMILEYAFGNLRLPEVRAQASDAAGRRVLEKNGFADAGGRFAVTADRWWSQKHGPTLERLHPDLKAILAAERAAGNEIAETGLGWPDADSVFVRLRHPFRAPRRELPKGVRFAELNDPHWWKAEYTTESPRHILAC
jgi:hypothetical protein